MSPDSTDDARAAPNDAYSKEVEKEFVLQRLMLTPSTLGRTMENVPEIVRATGGLQHGGHLIELFNRFEEFRPEWFDHWYHRKELVEGHVLQGALRIVNADEYSYYFKATRSVARRRRYQNCLASLRGDHKLALDIVDGHGPLTHSEFEDLFRGRYPQKSKAGRLLMDLYNYGEVARMGRKKQRPLYYTIGKLPYRLDVPPITEEYAREWLLMKSLSVYGPLTARDIAHWVGWNLKEVRETLKDLLEIGEIVKVRIEGDRETNYLRADDVPFLNSLAEDLPENSFVRVLFNDDSLLLGYYPRLGDYFGYPWRHPQLSEGVSWRAAILRGREIIGDAVVEMYAGSWELRLRSFSVRSEFATFGILSVVEEEFSRHAAFQGKSLVMIGPELV